MAGLIIKNADGNISITSDVPPLTGVVVRKIASASESLAVGALIISARRGIVLRPTQT